MKIVSFCNSFYLHFYKISQKLHLVIFQKHPRSCSPCCFAKNTRLRILSLKTMPSVAAAIYVNLPTLS